MTLSTELPGRKLHVGIEPTTPDLQDQRSARLSLWSRTAPGWFAQVGQRPDSQGSLISAETQVAQAAWEGLANQLPMCEAGFEPATF